MVGVDSNPTNFKIWWSNSCSFMQNGSSDSHKFYFIHLIFKASNSQMGAGGGRFWRNDSQNGGLGVRPPFLGSRFSKPLEIITPSKLNSNFKRIKKQDE